MISMWSLKKLRSNYRELTSIIYKQEERIQFLETKALHLSMFYVASQLLISVVTNSKPSPYQCRNWWKPFFLSLSIAVIFALNFATTLIKYVRMKYEQDRNFIDQGENYHHMAFLERHGSSINRSDDHLQIISNNNINPVVLEIDHIAPDHRDHQEQHKPDMFVVYQRYTHIWITVFVLLGFTALVLQSCRSSVCGDAVQ